MEPYRRAQPEGRGERGGTGGVEAHEQQKIAGDVGGSCSSQVLRDFHPKAEERANYAGICNKISIAAEAIRSKCARERNADDHSRCGRAEARHDRWEEFMTKKKVHELSYRLSTTNYSEALSISDRWRLRRKAISGTALSVVRGFVEGRSRNYLMRSTSKVVPCSAQPLLGPMNCGGSLWSERDSWLTQVRYQTDAHILAEAA